jgi:16S rRNA (uracil1498-N3)-methyltransferase
VLRLKPGEAVLLFNGRDGEWRATLAVEGKRSAALTVSERTREQTAPTDLHYLFAPLKHARLDYMVQKAVEMGASRLQPVLMQHSQALRVNLERMHANAIEAAEQCGILSIPEIGEPMSFERMFTTREPSRLLVFCDEAADVRDPIAALTAARTSSARVDRTRGRHRIANARSPACPVSCGCRLPRILRADTAAVAGWRWSAASGGLAEVNELPGKRGLFR